MSEDRVRKVVVLGDPEVGKTALLRRFVDDEYREEYRPTPGAMPWKKRVRVDDTELNIVFWDLGGRTLSFYPAHMSDSEGAILVCDLSRPATVDSLADWHSALRRKAGDVPAIVIASKSDMRPWICDVTTAARMGLEVFPASAKTGEGVGEAFAALLERLPRDD